jgi:hypothetical protein
MFWTKLAVVAIAGALGAGLVNRGVALFHDGTRTIMPELIGRRLRRREFVFLTFSSSIGLIVGFGIPFSLVSPIILSHGLWLGTDIIGAWFPGPFDSELNTPRKSYLGMLGSIASGAVFGGVLVIVLDAFYNLVKHLPVNFSPAMVEISGPIIFTLAAIPALAITYQYGVKNGAIAFLITLLGRQVSSALGLAGPDAWAFLLGMFILIIHVVKEVRCEPEPSETFAISKEQVLRVRRHLPWIAVLGAVYALASNLGIIMEGPQSLLAWAQGDRIAAINYTIARALSFLPLRTMSILSTGVFTMDGLGFAPTAGLVSPSAFVAAIAGAVVMSIEALSLVAIANFFNRYPCILKAANSMRTAMTKLLEVASLVGGMIAGNAISPGFGFFAVAGLYLLNEAAGTPVMRAAIGPVSIILIGITLNLFAFLH